MTAHDWRLTDPLDVGDAPPVRRPCCGDLLHPWERCKCMDEAEAEANSGHESEDHP